MKAPDLNDIFQRYHAVGVKCSGTLDPSVAQFVVWAETLIGLYQDQARWSKGLRTWQGFLAYKLREAQTWLKKWYHDPFDWEGEA